MKERLKQRGVQDGLVVTALGIAFLIYSIVQFQGVAHKVNWMMSPFLFPIIIAAVAILLGVGMIREAAYAAPEAKREDNGRRALVKVRDALVVIVLAIAYDAALRYIGFLAATAIYLALMTLFLGERKWYVIVLVAVISPLALYAIFKLGLNVRLP
ncbi:MAG: tripartite tricarboxylate transporter TctB family protein [Clostridia bacterium]|nr:tripartite tricarboxylate transporter TctB family protein [Clostridia bacterium]